MKTDVFFCCFTINFINILKCSRFVFIATIASVTAQCTVSWCNIEHMITCALHWSQNYVRSQIFKWSRVNAKIYRKKRSRKENSLWIFAHSDGCGCAYVCDNIQYNGLYIEQQNCIRKTSLPFLSSILLLVWTKFLFAFIWGENERLNQRTNEILLAFECNCADEFFLSFSVVASMLSFWCHRQHHRHHRHI